MIHGIKNKSLNNVYVNFEISNKQSKFHLRLIFGSLWIVSDDKRKKQWEYPSYR